MHRRNLWKNDCTSMWWQDFLSGTELSNRKISQWGSNCTCGSLSRSGRRLSGGRCCTKWKCLGSRCRRIVCCSGVKCRLKGMLCMGRLSGRKLGCLGSLGSCTLASPSLLSVELSIPLRVGLKHKITRSLLLLTLLLCNVLWQWFKFNLRWKPR